MKLKTLILVSLSLFSLIAPFQNALAEEVKYDARHTILALNMAIVSVQRIINTQDRIVLDQEYRNIINNLKLGSIEADKEIIELYQELLNTISGKILAAASIEKLHANYNEWAEKNISKGFIDSTLDLLTDTVTEALGENVADTIQIIGSKLVEGIAKIPGPQQVATLIAEAGKEIVSEYIARQNELLDSQLRYGLNADLWKIEKEEQESYNILQTKLLHSTWNLLHKYKLPDEYRIVQESVNDLFKAVNETSSSKSLEMLKAIENEFKIYPPYWIYRAQAAQKNGDEIETAKSIKEFENVWRPVLRNDPYMLEAAKYYVQESLKNNNKDTLKWLEVMCDNTQRTDWANNLFEGVAYFALGEKEKAIHRLEININFNSERKISELILAQMKAEKFNVFSLPYELKKVNGIDSLDYNCFILLSIAGDSDAMCKLGDLYAQGYFELKRDLSQAKALYKNAALSGNKTAAEKLAVLYFNESAYYDAYVWACIAENGAEEKSYFTKLWDFLFGSSAIRGKIEGVGLFSFAKISNNDIEMAKIEANAIMTGENTSNENYKITQNENVEESSRRNIGNISDLIILVCFFIICGVIFLTYCIWYNNYSQKGKVKTNKNNSYPSTFKYETNSPLKNLGKMLTERRKKTGMTIDDVFEKTNIKPEYIVGIENGNYSNFPSSIYTKAFIRTYLKLINAEDLLNELIQQLDQLKEQVAFVTPKSEAKKQNLKPQTEHQAMSVDDFIKLCKLGDVQKVEEAIINGANVNAQDKDGSSALMWATRQKQTKTVDLLLKHGANVNFHHSDGITALMMAVVNQDTETAELLLKHGADINAKSEDGSTALMRALEMGDIKTTELLLKHSTNVNTKDKNGRYGATSKIIFGVKV